MKNKVKQLRQLANFTQAAIAEQIGVSRQTIHAIEAGKYVPSTQLALRLAKVLRCTVEELFFLEE
jgi:putative transcriptional regulator